MYNNVTICVRYNVNGEERFLDQMNQIVRILKALREERKLSMDELSKLSGVSKSMLAQIERGGGNPTISTLWKISNGMKVPLDALTVRPKSPYELVKTSDLQPLLEDGKVIIPFSRMMKTTRFAVYTWNWRRELLESEPHLYERGRGV